MRPLDVVVLELLVCEAIEVPGPPHDESLCVGVEIRRAVGQPDGRYARIPQRPVEGLPEPRVAVAGEDSAAALAGHGLEA